MRTEEELKKIIAFAKEKGMPWVEIDGVKFPLPIKRAAATETEPASNPEIPSGPEAEYSEEEILFWATPHFDSLQEEKRLKEEHAKEDREFRSTV